MTGLALPIDHIVARELELVGSELRGRSSRIRGSAGEYGGGYSRAESQNKQGGLDPKQHGLPVGSTGHLPLGAQISFVAILWAFAIGLIWRGKFLMFDGRYWSGSAILAAGLVVGGGALIAVA